MSAANLVLAKQQLGLSPEASQSQVPKAYLDELRMHLELYPHDTNFRVTLEPRRGLGKVKCLENGCDGVEIQLTERVKASDGGKREGLGSLAKYRNHVRDHPTHISNRHLRVGAGKGRFVDTPTPVPSSSSSSSAKKSGRASVLSILDSPSGSSPTAVPRSIKEEQKPVPLPLGRRKSQSSLVRIKPEPTEPTLSSRKRNLDALHVKSESKEDRLDREFKKPRLSDAPKTPLAMVNRNTGSSENVLAAPPAPRGAAAAASSSTAPTKDLEAALAPITSQLHRLLAKPVQSPSDAVAIDRLINESSRINRQIEARNDAFNARKRLQPGMLKSEPIPDGFQHPSFANPTRTLTAPAIRHQPIASGSRLPVRPPVKLEQKPIIIPSSDSEEDYHHDHDYHDDDDVKMTLDEDGNPTIDPMAVVNRYADALPAHMAAIPHPTGDDGRDANGDFHGRGRDTFAGPTAHPDEINKFLITAGNAEAFDTNARVEDAVVKLGLKSQYDLVEGMAVALMPHQTIGVAWMVDKEVGKGAVKGGMLADDMGLGKTVQMIAVMCKNPSKDPLCKTSLVCCPAALLSQWKLEIEMKTNNLFKVLIYHGSNKPKKKSELLKHDVIITTYNTMALEWPDIEKEQKDKAKAKSKKKAADNFIASDSDDSDDDTKAKKKKKEAGLLFQIDFYRIILDEAQSIRNRRTRTSRAVTDLRAIYRWCLTGTPIINSVLDVYGLIRFLQIRPWYDFSEFNSHIAKHEKKNPQLAVTRLQAVLSIFLMRRMKTSELDGKRLIELPTKTITLVKLDFSEEERDIYTMVEARTQDRFNRFLRAGTVLKNYSQVLVLLLRLRQICSHPSLIQEGGEAFIAPDEVDDESASPECRAEVTRARNVVGAEFVRKMKAKLREAAVGRMAAEKDSADATIEGEDCPVCYDSFTDPIVTPCTHIFCRECITNVFNQPAPEDAGDYKANERPCPNCRTPISMDKIFMRVAFEPTNAELERLTKVEDDSDIEMVDAPTKTVSKSKGKSKANAIKIDDDSDIEIIEPPATKKSSKGKGKAAVKAKSRMVSAKKARSNRVLDSDDEGGADDVDDEEVSEDEEDDDDMSDFIVEEDEDEEEKDARRRMKARLGKRRATVVLDSDEEDDIEEFEEDPKEKEIIFGRKKGRAKFSPEEIKLMPRFLPSAKMKYMMEYLKALTLSAPEEKTMVISQWTGCLSLVSDYLTEAGILHVKYMGTMTRVQRDQSIVTFMSKDKAKVMLMSLKCGGVGLNLTRANHVVNLDLGWSQAVESQAFDRVHRLGQMLPVTVERLVINNTVEDRVLAMQERKQTLADGSLGEGSGKKIGRMSVKELANLFGLDHRGRVLNDNNNNDA